MSHPNGTSTTHAPSIANIGDLTNKVALITGASSSLGRAIALAYASAGAYVVSADLDPNPRKAPLWAESHKSSGNDIDTPTVDLINSAFPSENEKFPQRCAYVQTDVTKEESVENAVNFTVREFGRLDVMVNNAGIAAENFPNETARQDPRTHNLDVSIMDKDYAVNVRGVWLCCKYATAQMLKQEVNASGDRGHVISLSSVAGLVGLRNASPYCATKGAVLQMTKALALEYATDKIHVNCINPGFIDTAILEPLRQGVFQGDCEAFHAGLSALHPWGRLGKVEDVAKMAVFLAGDGASFITGAEFKVDGGYTAQ